MTLHDPIARVSHMLDHAREAVDMVRGRSRGDLDTDRQLNLALVRLVEVIGEAAIAFQRISARVILKCHGARQLGCVTA